MPRAIAVRILALALTAGVLAEIVGPGNAAGVNVPIFVVALVAAALAAAGPDGLRRMDVADAWLAPAAFALAAMVAIRTDPWLVAADLVFAAALTAGAIAALGGARITRGLVPAVIEVTVGTSVAAIVGAIEVLTALVLSPRTAAGRGRDDPGDARHLRLRALAPVLRGLVIAVPLVAVFVLLFSSADAVFERVTRALLDWRLDLDLVALTNRAVVVSFVAWGVAGLLALGAGLLPELAAPRPAPDPVAASAAVDAPPPPPWATWDRPRPASAPRPRLGTIEATTVLAVLDVLFAVFVALQLAYLFGGRDTLTAAGLTYAEYARRGFFELVAVAAIAGSIVVALDLLVARRSRSQLWASIALLGLTAVILVSALARLRLYQDAYGWTELRFVVLVAIGWLAVAVVATAVLLVRRQTRRSLHVLGILTLVTVAGMNLVGPQAYVAGRNLERAIDPALVPEGGRTGLDADYLASLGDEAVPAAVDAIQRLGPADRAAVEQLLLDRAAALARDPAPGWPAWNLGRERARSAVAAWRSGRPTP